MDHREDKAPFSRSERRFIESLMQRREWLTRPGVVLNDYQRHEAAALKWALGELQRIPMYRRLIQKAGLKEAAVDLENAGVEP